MKCFLCCVLECISSVVSAEYCEQIAKVRRKLQKIPNSRILFLDETQLRLNVAPNRTLTLPGEKPYVIVSDNSSYAARYDMIAVCSGEHLLLPKIFSPKERKGANARGINSAMLHQFIDDTLAQAVEGLDLYPLFLVIDRAAIHLNTDAIMQTFRDRGSGAIKEIMLMPPNAAKRLSPLDNALFHDWKQLCRQHGPVSNFTIRRVMADSWNNLTASNLHAHYQNCGLNRGADPYFDCPDPVKHAHRV